jgi:hypothetical protein
MRLVLLQELGDGQPFLLGSDKLIRVDFVQALAEEALGIALLGAPC